MREELVSEASPSDEGSSAGGRWFPRLTMAGESTPPNLNEEPRPYEPRFSFHPHQRRSRDFGQLPLRLWRVDPVHSMSL